MDEQLINIDYRPKGMNWLLSIMNKLRNSSSIILQKRMKEWSSRKIREMGLSIATKHTILNINLRVIDTFIRDLHKQLEEIDLDPYTKGKILYWGEKSEKYAYTIRSPLDPFKLVLFLNAFIFELYSTYEMFFKIFLPEFFDYILNRKINFKKIIQVLEENKNMKMNWINDLEKYRNYYIHEKAFWIGLEIKNISPLKFDLLLLNRDVLDIADAEFDEDYIYHATLVNIHKEYNKSIVIIHKWINEKIAEFESKVCTN